MRVAIALLLVACIGAATAYDMAQIRQLTHQMDSAMAEMKSRVDNIELALKEEHALTSKVGPNDAIHTQAVSQACSDAMTAFLNVWANTTCLALRTAILSYSDATQTNTAAWCTSGCADVYVTAGANVQSACSADRSTLWSTYAAATQLSYRQQIWFGKGICVQVSGTYCWPKVAVVASLYSSSLSLTTQVTVDQLTAACGDVCIPTIMTALSTYGYPTLATSVKAFNVFCLKIDGVYCRYSLNSWSTAYQTDATGRPNMSVLCAPCFLAYIRQLSEFFDSFASSGGITINPYSTFLTIFEGYCARTPSGGYCFDRVLENAQTYASVTQNCALLLSGLSCSASCSSTLTTLANDIGCCTTAALNVLFGGLTLTSGLDTATYINNKCGVNLNVSSSLVGSCSAYLVSGNLAINNFLYSYYTANQAAVIAAIQADLAIRLSIAASHIAITAVSDSTTTVTGASFTTQETQSSVSVSYKVTPSSSSEASTVKSAFTSSLSSDNTMTKTSSLDLSSRSDGTSASTADSSKSTANTVTNPDASSEAANAGVKGVAYSVMAAIATIVVAIANL